jgi:FMN phosphatase YigB (HAD superfamily)
MLDEFEMSPHLDACVFSDEVELAKPDPRLFVDALTAISVGPARAGPASSPSR